MLILADQSGLDIFATGRLIADRIGARARLRQRRSGSLRAAGARCKRTTTTVTKRRSTTSCWRQSAAALFGPVFRVLAALGAYRFNTAHQHRFHTMVTDLRGQEQRLTLAGSTVESIIPLSVGQLGNVTVSFLALSHAVRRHRRLSTLTGYRTCQFSRPLCTGS